MHLFRIVLLFIGFLCLGVCERVRDRIYYDVPAIMQCFRRLNATHQIGCSSDQGGNVGVFHYIPGDRELDWLIDHGPHKPYIVLLTPHTFTIKVINRLRESGKINGVLVIQNDTDLPLQFSPESQCPNTDYELYKGDSKYAHCKDVQWNSAGNDLLRSDIEFPIVSVINETQISFLIDDCYYKFNDPFRGSTDEVLRDDAVARSYPLCGAEIEASMDAVKDTPTCINRGKTRNLNPQTYCDPLGDSNVYGFLHPIPYKNSPEFDDTLRNKSVIIAAAKLDAAGLFQYMVPGVQSSVMGFVSLLAAAQALGQVKSSINPNTSKPIMFTFFQGESFDYMGSARMLYDMENGDFPYRVRKDSDGIHPIHPHHIGYFLEMSQVAAPVGQALYSHSDPLSQKNIDVKTGVSEIESLLSRYGEEVGLKIDPTAETSPLPPASVQTFLKKLNISGVVLADHDREYKNQFYNSYADVGSNLNYTVKVNDSQTEITELAIHLTDVATVFARTLFNMSTGHAYSGDGEITANNSTVAQMLYCFMLSPQCELFNFTVDKETSEKLPLFPYSFYVGINRLRNPVTLHTQKLLSYFLGDPENLTSSDCQNYADNDDDKNHPRSPYYNYVWIQGAVNESSPDAERLGMCLRTTANKSSGISPAFIDGHDLSDTKYPAWTESIWGPGIPNVRVFLMPDRNYEIQTLLIGLAVLVFCLPTVFFVDKRAKLLFSAD